MIPFRVEGRTTYRPYMVFAIMLVNVAVFFYEMILAHQGQGVLFDLFHRYGLTACVVGQEGPQSFFLDGLRSMFMHLSFLHILMNLAFLWVFGGRIEQFLGHWKFLAFYLVGGYIAYSTHILLAGSDCNPIIGAEGAIGAVMGGFFILYPATRVQTYVPFLMRTFKIPAALMLLFWFATQFFHDAESLLEVPAIQWEYIGGFLAGLAMMFIFTMFRSAPSAKRIED